MTRSIFFIIIVIMLMLISFVIRDIIGSRIMDYGCLIILINIGKEFIVEIIDD